MTSGGKNFNDFLWIHWTNFVQFTQLHCCFSFTCKKADLLSLLPTDGRRGGGSSARSDPLPTPVTGLLQLMLSNRRQSSHNATDLACHWLTAQTPWRPAGRPAAVDCRPWRHRKQEWRWWWRHVTA